MSILEAVSKPVLTKQLELIYFPLLAHGTFIGNVRLEAHKPTQLPINSTFHFGASTRYYTLREKPNIDGQSSDNADILPINLPDSEIDLDVSMNISLSVKIILSIFRI